MHITWFQIECPQIGNNSRKPWKAACAGPSGATRLAFETGAVGTRVTEQHNVADQAIRPPSGYEPHQYRGGLW